MGLHTNAIIYYQYLVFITTFGNYYSTSVSLIFLFFKWTTSINYIWGSCEDKMWSYLTDSCCCFASAILALKKVALMMQPQLYLLNRHFQSWGIFVFFTGLSLKNPSPVKDKWRIILNRFLNLVSYWWSWKPWP